MVAMTKHKDLSSNLEQGQIIGKIMPSQAYTFMIIYINHE